LGAALAAVNTGTNNLSHAFLKVFYTTDDTVLHLTTSEGYGVGNSKNIP
jgi:hypothetical protein